MKLKTFTFFMIFSLLLTSFVFGFNSPQENVHIVSYCREGQCLTPDLQIIEEEITPGVNNYFQNRVKINFIFNNHYINRNQIPLIFTQEQVLREGNYARNTFNIPEKDTVLVVTPFKTIKNYAGFGLHEPQIVIIQPYFKDKEILSLLIAHELGHSFGLPHVKDPKNLMFPKLTSKEFDVKLKKKQLNNLKI